MPTKFKNNRIMVEDLEDESMMLRRGEKVAVILIPILLVSFLLLPLFSPEITISGTVRDEWGDPLPGATVHSSGSIFVSSSVTDGEGMYSLTIKGGYGDPVLKAEKDGHWIHKRICHLEGYVVAVGDFDFQLAENQKVWVTYAYVFCTVQGNQTSAEIGIHIGSSSSQKVLINDLAGSGKTFEYALGGGERHSSNAQSLFWQILVEISGEYQDTPGVADNCYAIDVLSQFSGYGGPDYLNENEVGGYTFQLPPGDSTYNSFTLGEQAIIPVQLSPSISVNVLGKAFNHTFVVELLNPTQNKLMVDCELGNIDVVAHEYKLFTDEAGFLHIWQIE